MCRVERAGVEHINLVRADDANTRIRPLAEENLCGRRAENEGGIGRMNECIGTAHQAFCEYKITPVELRSSKGG